MFEDAPGPSHADVAEAAVLLDKEAVKRQGRVLVKRGTTPEESKQWVLMNKAAEWLVSQEMGTIENRSTESFTFVSKFV